MKDAVALVVLVVAVGVAGGFAHGAGDDHLVGLGDAHPADRIIALILVDEAEIVARDIHRMGFGDLSQVVLFAGGEIDVLLEGLRGGDVVLELLPPVDVCPVFGQGGRILVGFESAG